MIALTDTEIRDWTEKINNLSPLSSTRFDILPRYTSHSTYPSIVINKILISGFQTMKPNSRLSEVSANDYVIEYSHTFSISIDKDIMFTEILNKLRKEEVGNQCIINEQTFDIKLKDDTVTQTKEEHIVNNRAYMRYSFRSKSLISNIIVEFFLIEKALLFVNREAKFKVNDVVSLVKDRSDDYIITHQDINGKMVTVVKIEEVTESLITYGYELQLSTEDITWSRNNRINDIINLED